MSHNLLKRKRGIIFGAHNDMADTKSLPESIARSFGYIYGREKNVQINTISQSPTMTTAGSGVKEIEHLMDSANKISVSPRRFLKHRNEPPRHEPVQQRLGGIH